MRYLKNIRCGAILLFFSVFASCSDDELNSSELKVYVNTGLQNHVEIALIQTPAGALGQSTIEFPVRSTRELMVDAEVGCVIEEALAESYNEANKTAYKLLTGDLYKLTLAKTTIKQGEQISQEPIRIELTNADALTAEEGYILPIRLEEANSADKGLEISKNLNTVYITITSTFRNVKIEESPVAGEFIEKNGWKATATKTYNPYIAANMIDGNPATTWFGQGTPDLTFDMGAKQTIKGLRLTPNYVAFAPAYNITGFEVLISNDGVEWDNQGALSAAAPVAGTGLDNPDYKYVHFYSPVETRYFRLKITVAPYSYTALAEVDAYK